LNDEQGHAAAGAVAWAGGPGSSGGVQPAIVAAAHGTQEAGIAKLRFSR
jgi:hypothetical protein